MRNLSVLSATTFLMLSGAAYAQTGNYSDVNQSGSLNVTEVEQIGGQKGWSQVIQNGSQGTVNVTQSDDATTSSDAGNTSYVTQGGSEGTVNVNQDQTLPTGAANYSSVDQNTYGSGSFADITQVGDGNSSEATQGPGAGGGSYLALTVDQNGTGNTSQVWQYDDNNSITIIQSNNQNLSEVYQAGDGNTVGSTQGGDGSNWSFVDQGGYGNNITVSQDGLAFAETSDVVQDGTGNSVAVTQEGVGNVSYVGDYLGGTVGQDGSGNELTIYQGGEDGYSNATQFGVGNVMSVEQGAWEFTTLNTSEAHQDGDGNAMSITQDGDGNNYSEASQSGDGNEFTLTQAGADLNSLLTQGDGGYHTGVVGQEGQGSFSLIDQMGSYNGATVYQGVNAGTNFNQSTVYQTGTQNGSFVNQ